MTIDTVTVETRQAERAHCAVSWNEDGITDVEVLEIQTARGAALYGLAFEGRARQLEDDEAFRQRAFNVLCIHYSNQTPPNKDEDAEDAPELGNNGEPLKDMGQQIDGIEYQIADR